MLLGLCHQGWRPLAEEPCRALREVERLTRNPEKLANAGGRCWKDTLGRKRSFRTHRPPYPTRRGLVSAWQETKKFLHKKSGRTMSGRYHIALQKISPIILNFTLPRSGTLWPIKEWPINRLSICCRSKAAFNCKNESFHSINSAIYLITIFNSTTEHCEWTSFIPEVPHLKWPWDRRSESGG